MNDQLDTQALLRAQLVAQQIRKSDLFPALIGGVAGGIAGALMAVIIAGRITTRREDNPPREKESRKPDWSARDLMQLAAVVASLVKQIQAWSKNPNAR
jgi:glycerol uptake facilitator-like aquaporin